MELVEDTIRVGPYALVIRRPPSPEALIDESRFETDEFMPYWAELWASGVELATAVADLDLRGARAVELGCGLALPSIAAALGGATVVATDWAPEAVALARANAARNGVELETLVVSWTEPDELVALAPFDIVLGADLLYEHRNVEPLLALLPRLGTDVLLAEPGRPYAATFFERAGDDWTIVHDGRLARLRR